MDYHQVGTHEKKNTHFRSPHQRKEAFSKEMHFRFSALFVETSSLSKLAVWTSGTFYKRFCSRYFSVCSLGNYVQYTHVLTKLEGFKKSQNLTSLLFSFHSHLKKNSLFISVSPEHHQRRLGQRPARENRRRPDREQCQPLRGRILHTQWPRHGACLRPGGKRRCSLRHQHDQPIVSAVRW